MALSVVFSTFLPHLAFAKPPAAAATSTNTPRCAQPKRFKAAPHPPTTAIKNQGNTNTCWSFATTSFLETEVQRLGGPALDLSEIYFVRHAYVDKALAYVRLHGANTFWEGGQNHDVIDMLARHGVVPESVYSGLKPNASGPADLRHDHAELSLVLKSFLQALVGQRKLSERWLAALHGILDGYLGAPPEIFEWSGKKYTPASFRDEFLHLVAGDYVQITSFSHHPYYRMAALEVPDNWSHAPRYLNLPLADFSAVIDHALAAGYTLAWGGDVEAPQYDRACGYAKMPDESSAPSQELRQRFFDRWETTDDHSMHLVGKASDEKGQPYYVVKDSYGQESGPFAGYRYLSRSYLLLKTVYVLVHKSALPAELRAKSTLF